ncbi:MAG: VWA domain-containing protein [Methanobacteriota archaeon]|nr:MAG: VWA domain-containing protein [Euryarchaeota archaeon]
MSLESSVKILAIAIVLSLTAVGALAVFVGPAPASPPGGDPTLPLGQGRVRTDKNCYLPGQTVTITLKNVGQAALVYSSLPDFEVENETIGTVRMVRDWTRAGYHLDPGASVSWTWDQKWRAWDGTGHELNKGMFVPRGGYVVIAEALVGVEISDVVQIARSAFAIGDCLAQVSAGDDIIVGEGRTFQFNPRIQITGDATITSITWDLDPAVDSNGDGNTTNDMDLIGTHPSFSFGDDGVYPVVMNVRGFGRLSGMDRVAQDVVFAIDSSDSMLWRDPLDYRKIAVKDYVAWMVPNDRGAVVDFDSAARVVNGDHLSSDYARIQADVDTIDSSGGVFLSAGLLLSLYELRDYGDATHKWLVIFETGAETENPRDPFYIPRAIDLAKDLGVAIYTVGLNVVEPEQRALMLQIADETGGRFFNSASASNLRKIYDDIAGLNATQGAFFTVSDSLSVTVDNTPPSLAVDSSVPVNMTFRVAGEKYHDVAFSLLKDGAEIANATIIRMPGDPDNQSAAIGTIDFDVASTYEARIVYTPDDDPVNGQESGANPAELILVFSDGTNVTLGHTFNVNHPDTWVWDVPDLEAFFVGRAVSLPVSISDPGTDDVTIAWDWGDGTIDLRTVFNDGVGPDPYPSPWGLPVSMTDVGVHTYATAGSYSVSLTVTDDDAGSTVLLFTLSVG